MKKTTSNSSIDGVLVKALMTQYHNEVGIIGSAKAAQAISSAAHASHSNYAWTALAVAVTERKEVWDDLVAHASVSAKSVAAALALSGPVAQRQAGDVEISPIALQVGEAKTYTGVHSKEQLSEILRSEPALVESLKRSGRTIAIATEAKEMLKDAPEYLVKEIFTVATNPKYAATNQKGKILRNGEMVTVKAGAHADLSALISEGGRAYRIASGLQRVVQASMKLTHWWAESALFWSEIPESSRPVIPEGEEDNGYDGGEDTSWSSPTQTYTFPGEWGRMETWQAREEAKPQMAEDFTQAAQEAEALLTALSELMEAGGVEVTYAWRVIDADAGQFEPITSRDEAEDMLLTRSITNREKQAAQAIGLTEAHMEQFGLVEATLGQFDAATATVLADLRKEFGHA